MSAPLAVGGNRLTWPELPAHVRRAIEDATGAPVLAADGQTGGFSPGLAAVLRLADGRRVFVKSVNGDRNVDSVRMLRDEIAVLRRLPANVPAPRLLWDYDDGDWVALMTEAVDGRMPAQPWLPAELDAFLAVAVRLVELLTPAPITAPRLVERFESSFTGWRTLAAAPGAEVDRLDPWARDRLDRLAAIEETWPAAAEGDSLLHCDLRGDNVLFTPDGGAVVVDWPSVGIGAGWIDLLLAVPSIVMHGGGSPDAIWRRFEPGRRADPEAVTAVLVAAAGFFVHRSGQPAPPNLPTLREFQRAQGVAALDWLRRRV